MSICHGECTNAATLATVVVVTGLDPTSFTVTVTITVPLEMLLSVDDLIRNPIGERVIKIN